MTGSIAKQLNIVMMKCGRWKMWDKKRLELSSHRNAHFMILIKPPDYRHLCWFLQRKCHTEREKKSHKKVNRLETFVRFFPMASSIHCCFICFICAIFIVGCSAEIFRLCVIVDLQLSKAYCWCIYKERKRNDPSLTDVAVSSVQPFGV